MIASRIAGSSFFDVDADAAGAEGEEEEPEEGGAAVAAAVTEVSRGAVLRVPSSVIDQSMLIDDRDIQVCRPTPVEQIVESLLRHVIYSKQAGRQAGSQSEVSCRDPRRTSALCHLPWLAMAMGAGHGGTGYLTTIAATKTAEMLKCKYWAAPAPWGGGDHPTGTSISARERVTQQHL